MPNGKLNKNVVNTICYRTTFVPTDIKHGDDKTNILGVSTIIFRAFVLVKNEIENQ